MQTAGKSSIFWVVLLALVVIAVAIFYPAFKGEKGDSKESVEPKAAKPKSNEPQIVKTFPTIGQTDVDSRIKQSADQLISQSDLAKTAALVYAHAASGGELAMGLARLGVVPDQGYLHNYIAIGPGSNITILPPYVPSLQLTVAPIPEPSTLLLLGLGAVMIKRKH